MVVLSTDLKTAVWSRQKLIIITDIKRDSTFVQRGLLSFEINKTGDYQEDLNFKKFESWLALMLSTIELGSTIVMNNAPYHCRHLEQQ